MLKNLKKIMLFINLLNNRKYVTKKEATEFCKIGTRSFYRYINLLSEINVPIYYDKSVKGYRLASRVNNQKELATVNEVIIQIISLIKYKKTSQGSYQEEIDYLLKKVISISKINIEETINAYFNQIKPTNSKEGEDNIIKSILIDIAVANSLTLKVTFTDGKLSKKNTLNIEKPMLEYNKNWYLADKLTMKKIPLIDIKHVMIL